MDVQMPVMDGIEAARRIRALPPPAGRVPIAALTANVMETERERCLAAGMDRVLAKPVAWPELFAAMAELTFDGNRAAAESPRAEVAAESATAPSLLDPAVLAAIGEGMEPEVLAGFLRKAVAEAERAQEVLEGLPDQPDEARRVAHRLRGTAGSFGLARVGALAGAIENRLECGEDATGLVAKLRQVVAATRTEVEDFLLR
jgi:CheY-like chemotaxis protein